MLATRHAIATDIDLATLEAGEGGRPLLLVHGFTGAKEDFADFVEPLAELGWWVVVPDLRGHGTSSQPTDEGAYSLPTFADDLLALTTSLGWTTFTLLGHSMGGMIAQELVLRGGDEVDRLILMDTCPGPVEGLDLEAVEKGVEIIHAEGLPALLALMAALPAPPRSPSEERVRAERPGYAEWSDGKALQCSPAMYAAMALTLSSRPDRTEELRSLAVPTLVVVGEDDRAFIGPSRRMADAIDGARLVVLPDAAHCPQFEHPEVWWDAVSSFLGAAQLVD